MAADSGRRIVSGMRPTGALHLGHYHGAIKNWLQLQTEAECFFFVADWHALTTHYEDPAHIGADTRAMVIDWLACGLSPSLSTIFIQSQVPEHAQLHVLLSMITPLSWLERVPTYKDQIQRLHHLDLATYGFLGYPLLQTADIVIYQATHVPVGEDQVAHVELSREVVRRFNHLYGREADLEAKAAEALGRLGRRTARLYEGLRRRYQEHGEEQAWTEIQEILEEQQHLTMLDRERLLANFEGRGRRILVEPEALVTEQSRLPGLDGQKMSKSYGNTIALREHPDSITQKVRTMPTDPARVHRSDPGEPTKCPVYALHRVYSAPSQLAWVEQGCRQAGIGCLECKKPVIEAIIAQLKPIQERIVELEAEPSFVNATLTQGAEQARDIARDTLDEVNEVLGLSHRWP